LVGRLAAWEATLERQRGALEEWAACLGKRRRLAARLPAGEDGGEESDGGGGDGDGGDEGAAGALRLVGWASSVLVQDHTSGTKRGRVDCARALLPYSNGFQSVCLPSGLMPAALLCRPRATTLDPPRRRGGRCWGAFNRARLGFLSW
jgi:hypothetical protein